MKLTIRAWIPFVILMQAIVWVGPARGAETQPGILANEAYRYRVNVAFSGHVGAETLVNFPALIVLSESLPGFHYEQFASPRGYDLLLLDSTATTALNYDIESWNTNGSSYVWVQVPSLVGTNTSVWAYWGNSAATNPLACVTNGATWDSNFLAVFHLAGTNDAGKCVDSTAFRRDATNFNTLAATGIVGSTRSFNGTSAYLVPGGSPFMGTIGNKLTISMWLQKNVTQPAARMTLVSQHSGIETFINDNNGGSTVFYAPPPGDNAIEGSVVPAGSWWHLAVTADGTLGSDQKKIYTNAVPTTHGGNSRANYGEGVTGPVDIGGRSDNGQFFNGMLDEVRIEHTARSTEWIQACWMNQGFNATFSKYGLVVDTGSSQTPLISNAGGATGITTNEAWLNGALLSTGGAPTSVSVYWGASDGGSVKTSWGRTNVFGLRGLGALTTNVTGLAATTQYYYRFYATNSFGEAWSSPSASFTTAALPADFTAWASRMRITFSGYFSPDPLTNFPALVVLGNNIDDFNYNQFASPTNGGDLRFSDANGFELNYEIESWHSTSNSYVWVQVPVLTNNCFIWAYWGNPGATVPPPCITNGSTWDSNFLAVYHLDRVNAGGKCWDSTAYRRDATNYDTTATAGPVGDGRNFNGTNAWLGTGSSYLGNIGSKLTVSLWLMKTVTVTNHRMYLVSQAEGGLESFINDGNGGDTVFYTPDQGAGVEGVVVPSNVWTHVALTADAAAGDGFMKGFFDGTQMFQGGVSSANYGVGDTHPVSIGAQFWPAQFLDGRLDEVRIERTARNATWLGACRLNQAFNSNFMTYELSAPPLPPSGMSLWIY